MLSLRKTTLDDVECIGRWHKASNVKRWVPIENWLAYYQAVSQNDNYYLYSVFLRQGILIAYIAAEVENGNAAICLVVDPDQHGKGIGTAVLQKMLQQATSLFGDIHSYRAGIFPENIASIKCFEKAGFKKFGKGNDGEILYSYNIRRM